VTVEELLRLYRVEVADLEVPPFIDDLTVVSYIDDAQKMFCRLTYGIEATRGFHITLRTGEAWYKLPAGVLDLREAWLDGRPLDIVPMECMRDRGLRLQELPDGWLRALITGLEKNTVRLPAPAGAELNGQRITLSVYRLPTPIETVSDELEIDEQHHQHLLLWVKYRAYDNHDAEMFNRRKADEYEARFRAYCAQAKDEQNRAYHPAGFIAYGGY